MRSGSSAAIASRLGSSGGVVAGGSAEGRAARLQAGLERLDVLGGLVVEPLGPRPDTLAAEAQPVTGPDRLHAQRQRRLGVRPAASGPPPRLRGGRRRA